MTATLESSFINVTGSPADGRDARRIHVRSTVMSNYHRRKARKKQDMTIQRSAVHEAPSALPIRVAPALITVQPAVLPAPERQELFQPRSFSNPDHAHTSRIIVRFLCGQVNKAIQDFSCVSFIHQGCGETASQCASDNPLMLCRDLLRQHYDPATLHRPALWQRIDVMQQDVYARVGQTSECLDLGQSGRQGTVQKLMFSPFSVRHGTSGGSCPQLKP